MSDESEIVCSLKKVAYLLRGEIMQLRDWSFTGTFDNFNNPPLLKFFLSNLLFDRHGSKIAGKQDEEVDKIVEVACQFLIQNTRNDRQVKGQAKQTDNSLYQTVQTPLSIGLPLAIHTRVCDRGLIQNLSDAYIGSDYQRIIDLKKRIEQSVLHHMKDSGGFCLPDFVIKDVNVWFAIDNIDLLEDTPTGQETFHWTVIVINQ